MNETCPACGGSKLAPSGRAVCPECGGAGVRRRVLTPEGEAYMSARCAPPWQGNDEDAVRYRHNERQAQRDEREEYENWSYFHGE